MANEVARVAERCRAAQESGDALDLSACSLRSVPQAVLVLMAGVPLRSATFAQNALTALPPSLNAFATIVSLNLAGNALRTLPASLAHLAALEILVVSRNHLQSVHGPILASCP